MAAQLDTVAGLLLERALVTAAPEPHRTAKDGAWKGAVESAAADEGAGGSGGGGGCRGGGGGMTLLQRCKDAAVAAGCEGVGYEADVPGSPRLLLRVAPFADFPEAAARRALQAALQVSAAM